MATKSDYRAAWRDLNRRSAIFWTVFLTYLPGVGSVVFVSGLLYGEAAKPFTPCIALGWLAAFIAAGYYRGIFRCPRCGERFFRSDEWHNTFTSRCLNCDLQWGDDPGTDVGNRSGKGLRG
jgi:hypothetical protein